MCCCSKIAETEAVVSVNEKKLLEMHMYMHVFHDAMKALGLPSGLMTDQQLINKTAH
jgi:hypothetical protein